jgi:hypothetical protein
VAEPVSALGKLVKKVRVGSSVRRVYDAAQTPLERVLAGGQCRKEQVAELKKFHLSLDPFQLGKVIDQKLERIYDLANRRLRPKATQESRAGHTQEKTQSSRRNGCGKAAPWKSIKPNFSTELANRAKSSRFALSHSRDDGRVSGYISNVSTVGLRVTFLNGLTRKAERPTRKPFVQGYSEWSGTLEFPGLQM